MSLLELMLFKYFTRMDMFVKGFFFEGYKINMQKSVAFLYSLELTERGMKKTTPVQLHQTE